MPDFDGPQPLSDLDDLALLRAHVAGSTAAFAELYRRHEKLLMFVAMNIVRDRGDAEDVVQSALLSIVRAAPSFEGRAAVRNWMVRITRNAALDALRRRRVRPQLHVELGMGDDVVDRADVCETVRDRAVVDELLWELPELTRRIVVLIDLLDQSYETVAELLDIPVGTVKSRRSRGLRAMAERLEW